MRHWWRRDPKITVASLEQVQKRVAQLERALARGNGRTLNVMVDSYAPAQARGRDP